MNPLGIENNQEIYLKNERHINFLETKNFGKIALLKSRPLCG